MWRRDVGYGKGITVFVAYFEKYGYRVSAVKSTM
jgi:hypothetical protein